MTKTEIKPTHLLYPRPALLVGANCDGKANFMAVGGGGAANAEPPMIGVPIRHQQHTLGGMKQCESFSINTPSAGMVKEMDYCGIVSGRDRDKVKDCGFTIFYGKLENAPLIEECPINMECKIVHMLDLGTHSFVIGEVKGLYISDDCLTDGKPDIKKIEPMIFNLNEREYATFGESIGKAFNIGNTLK
jgi:flavin reductase (DIM6/NTAB) family NADH-FMN oxidoreductase RutF